MITTGTETERGQGMRGLWFGLLGPPIIWAIRFGASYLLVPYACWWGWVPVLHMVTGAALAGVAIAGLVAWRRWRQTEGAADGGAAESRARFMALVGMFGSALFFVVIGAEGIAVVMLDPCLTATESLP